MTHRPEPTSARAQAIRMEAAMHQVNMARQRLDDTPWWRPIKRQDASQRLRLALYRAACIQLGIRP